MVPGQWGYARDPSAKELQRTTVLRLALDESSVKVSAGPPDDEDEDYELPIWAARYPVRQVIGAAEECPRQHPDAVKPPGFAPFRDGRTLEEVMLETYNMNYPPETP